MVRKHNYLKPMAKTSTLRYQLPRKAIKGNCPDCFPKHRKTLSRYVDMRTGEPLPEALGFGWCDRKSNCGYHLRPYTKGPSGMSYADQVFEQWKADNPLPNARAPRQQPRYTTTSSKPRKLSSPSTATPPVIAEIPRALVDRTLGRYEENQLAILLHHHFGPTVARDLLRRFQVGTSTHWPGACIFWYIDEQSRVRGGQIKLLGPDWHTVKYVDKDDTKRTKTNWVHTVMQRRLENEHQPVPDWLLAYSQHGTPSNFLFGLPQLLTAPPDQPIALVESPKTAIIATAYLPDFLWLATGAKGYLTADRLEPLRNRSLLLWPDLDAYHDAKNPKGHCIKGWLSRVAELNAEGFDLEVSDYLERRATDEQKRKGLDLADFLLATQAPGNVPDQPFAGVSNEPMIVKTWADWVCTPGSILRPDPDQLTYL